MRKPTKSKYFKLPVAVFGILEQDGKTLLCRRFNTGHQDGNYGLPAGHIDGNETLTTALIRELKEEIGVEVTESEVSPALFVHRHSKDTEYIDIFFKVTSFRGIPKIMEPDKCDAFGWYHPEAFPDNLIEYVRLALKAIGRGEKYLETGWDNSSH